MTEQDERTNRWVALFWAAKRVLRKQDEDPDSVVDADLEAAVEAIEQHDMGETQ